MGANVSSPAAYIDPQYRARLRGEIADPDENETGGSYEVNSIVSTSPLKKPKTAPSSISSSSSPLPPLAPMDTTFRLLASSLPSAPYLDVDRVADRFSSIHSKRVSNLVTAELVIELAQACSEVQQDLEADDLVSAMLVAGKALSIICTPLSSSTPSFSTSLWNFYGPSEEASRELVSSTLGFHKEREEEKLIDEENGDGNVIFNDEGFEKSHRQINEMKKQGGNPSLLSVYDLAQLDADALSRSLFPKPASLLSISLPTPKPGALAPTFDLEAYLHDAAGSGELSKTQQDRCSEKLRKALQAARGPDRTPSSTLSSSGTLATNMFVGSSLLDVALRTGSQFLHPLPTSSKTNIDRLSDNMNEVNDFDYNNDGDDESNTIHFLNLSFDERVLLNERAKGVSSLIDECVLPSSAADLVICRERPFISKHDLPRLQTRLFLDLIRGSEKDALFSSSSSSSPSSSSSVFRVLLKLDESPLLLSDLAVLPSLLAPILLSILVTLRSLRILIEKIVNAGASGAFFDALIRAVVPVTPFSLSSPTPLTDRAGGVTNAIKSHHQALLQARSHLSRFKDAHLLAAFFSPAGSDLEAECSLQALSVAKLIWLGHQHVTIPPRAVTSSSESSNLSSSAQRLTHLAAADQVLFCVADVKAKDALNQLRLMSSSDHYSSDLILCHVLDLDKNKSNEKIHGMNTDEGGINFEHIAAELVNAAALPEVESGTSSSLSLQNVPSEVDPSFPSHPCSLVFYTPLLDKVAARLLRLRQYKLFTHWVAAQCAGSAIGGNLNTAKAYLHSAGAAHLLYALQIEEEGREGSEREILQALACFRLVSSMFASDAAKANTSIESRARSIELLNYARGLVSLFQASGLPLSPLKPILVHMHELFAPTMEPHEKELLREEYILVNLPYEPRLLGDVLVHASVEPDFKEALLLCKDAPSEELADRDIRSLIRTLREASRDDVLSYLELDKWEHEKEKKENDGSNLTNQAPDTHLFNLVTGTGGGGRIVDGGVKVDMNSASIEMIIEASQEAFAKAIKKDNDPAAAATAMLGGARTLWKIEKLNKNCEKSKSSFILKKRVEMLALALNALSRIQGGAWRMLIPVHDVEESKGGVEFMDEEALELELQRATEEWKRSGK